MKLPHLRPISLATLLSTMATIIITINCIFVCSVLYSDYKFSGAIIERNEDVLSKSLLKGAMPLAVAANDLELVKSIVHDHISFEEIFSIEVRNNNNEIIYREGKSSDARISLISKDFVIYSPYDALAIDDFDSKSKVSPKLGTITISFSSDMLHGKVANQFIFTISLAVISLVLSVIFIFFFHKMIRNKMKIVLNLMEAIKGSKSTYAYPSPEGISELAVIDLSLRDMANTIYDRDKALKHSLEQALLAQKTAQDAEDFKDDFIRAISHDIKTPVGVVVNLLELIYEQSTKGQSTRFGKEFTDQIFACYRSAQALAGITDELFDFEQFQRQELINKPVTINLIDMFDKIFSLYQQKFKEKNLSFAIKSENYSEGIDYTVMLDENKVLLILENLIDNAHKFTSVGIVDISWQLINDCLIVRIRDSGVGIPETQLHNIFEKYKQLGNLEKNKREGRGLGLYYVTRLCESLTAKISVFSTVGIGSVFELTIPCSMPSYNIVEQDEDNHPIRIMIIDDDEGTCYTLQKMLEKLGVSSSYECIPELGISRLLKEKPDIALIDYHMLGQTGDELAMRAQATLPKGSVFYVCITAESNSNKLQFLESIFDVVLRKPIYLEPLKKVIDSAANAKRIMNNVVSRMIEE